jgi:molybdate transport system substrate-binding protein
MNSARLLLFAFVCSLPAGAIGGEAHVAVAANFALPLNALGEAFGRQTGHKLVASAGSTGKLYAQIKNGAPFDVFLSADDVAPKRLEDDKLAAPGSRFTYALGRLVLWSPHDGLVDPAGAVLKGDGYRRLAMANPRLAPYGAAAQQVMEKLGVWRAAQGKVVQGENIAQTFQFVASGNADLGFVALAQLDAAKTGSRWIVPSALHTPIRQDAVVLRRAAANAAAHAFAEYLRGAEARQRIRAFGYDLP